MASVKVLLGNMKRTDELNIMMCEMVTMGKDLEPLDGYVFPGYSIELMTSGSYDEYSGALLLNLKEEQAQSIMQELFHKDTVDLTWCSDRTYWNLDGDDEEEVKKLHEIIAKSSDSKIVNLVDKVISAVKIGELPEDKTEPDRPKYIWEQ